MSLPQWPRAWGVVTLSGSIREHIEDFQVYEVLGFEPDGTGEHLWLEVEKRGLTTPEAQQLLARAFRISVREVYFAGMKDRRALTTQWFSLRVGMKRGVDDLPDLPDGLRLLRAAKNSRKLRRGSHKANRFALTVRGVSGDTSGLSDRLALIARRGVPNYFGEQRFGHDGGNLDTLLAWWRNEAPEPSRRLRSILLSAARGFVFNAVLAERVVAGVWDKLLVGESVNLDGTSRQFSDDAASRIELEERLSELDIHPTGPLWGKGDTEAKGEAAFLERGVVSRYDELCQGLLKEGLEHARRPLRLAVRDLQHSLTDAELHLSFVLTSGAYATAVLREIVNITAAHPIAEEGGD